MPHAKQSDGREKLLLEEFKEAWTHYRHLESTRTQYLGFFFTVMFSALGFSITVLKDIQPQNIQWLSFGLFTLVWLLYILTIILFASIRKLGFVLRHYQNVIKQVRGMFYPREQNIDAILNVLEINHPVMKMKIYKMQYASEFIFLGSSIILTIIEIIGAFVTIQWIVLYDWQIFIVRGFAITMIVIVLYVILIPEIVVWVRNRKAIPTRSKK